MYIMFIFPISYKCIIKCFNSQVDYPVCATVSLSVELLIDTYVYYLCAVCICLALIPSYFSVVPPLRSASPAPCHGSSSQSSEAIAASFN